MNTEDIIEIYENHKSELLTYIIRMIASQDAAEDIIQDSFANMINYMQKKNVDNPRAFLYKTAHNLAVNYIKKNSRISNADESLMNHEYYDSHENDLEFEELKNKIRTIVSNLDEELHSLFVMKKDLNLSTVEIAQRTGKSERTVRRKLKRASDYIASQLEKDGLI